MESSLTIGGARPWYESPTVGRLFGGMPDEAQRSMFANTVMDRVRQTFVHSGIIDSPSELAITLDPTIPAAHSMSVVSNTLYGPVPQAAGITAVGYHGFSFIDRFDAARSVDELGWVVARNVAHELMHAFGVADHFDTTGRHIDSAVTHWATMADPNATFSPEAVAALRGRDFNKLGPILRTTAAGELVAAHQHTGAEQAGCVSCGFVHAAQSLAADSELQPSPVPEPATWLAWTLAAGALAVARRRGRGRGNRARAGV